MYTIEIEFVLSSLCYLKIVTEKWQCPNDQLCIQLVFLKLKISIQIGQFGKQIQSLYPTFICYTNNIDSNKLHTSNYDHYLK